MGTTALPMTTSSVLNTDSQALAFSVVAELAATAPAVTAYPNTMKPIGNIHIVSDPVKNNSKIQRFVQKLWKIVNSKSDLVGWSEDGSRVVVHRPKDFAKRVLPRYFNTSNMSSFTRQLHFYGFKKTLTAKRSRADNWECQHDYFVRDHPEWLVRITRKRCNMQMASQEETSQLRKEIDELRGIVAQQQKQMQSMAAMLVALSSTRDTDRKRKASVQFAQPTQQPRIHYSEASPPPDLEGVDVPQFFESMQNQTQDNLQDVFGLHLEDLSDLDNLSNRDFNYWS